MANQGGQFEQTRLVTGDAVVLDLNPAGFASRMVALCIDVALQVSVLIGATLLLALVEGAIDTAMAAALAVATMVLVIVVYPVAFETLSRGRSLGKYALGLRVVSEDGGPVRFRQALTRGLTGFVELWMTFGVVAVVVSMLNRDGRRVGDFLAGTMVVQERAGRRPSTAIEMPPRMAEWAQHAELSGLPAETASMAHQYVLRYDELTEATRYEMGVQVANTVARYVAPPPPQWASPPEFLSAVLAERRRREEARRQHGSSQWS
ncbi:RDD family protein [Nocardiopsis ansamitocini]|uniref:Transporter n=1 Tax=Nocardiopsis ansamitocini TaxID=1670832 RepID=A0A9W6P9X4_9ACTN|nr:RDD family protein [Nocardiopsis ansamitocini]GLU49658.1 transporter [Nocardiopsis ansamitocini]